MTGVAVFVKAGFVAVAFDVAFITALQEPRGLNAWDCPVVVVVVVASHPLPPLHPKSSLNQTHETARVSLNQTHETARVYASCKSSLNQTDQTLRVFASCKSPLNQTHETARVYANETARVFASCTH